MRLLERSVIEAVGKRSGLVAHTTENPGVWVGDAGDGVPRYDDRKLAAVGVHLRRNVSSFGVGVNGFTDLGWFDRIVACGLPGRKATSIVAEMKNMNKVGQDESLDLMTLGKALAKAVADCLGGIEEVATETAEARDDGDEIGRPSSADEKSK